MDTLEINIRKAGETLLGKKGSEEKEIKKRKKKPRKMCECERNDQRVSERDSGM